MSATCHRLISVCSRSFPPHWQRSVSSPSDWSVYPLQPSDWFRLTSFSFLWLIDPTLRPFEVRDWVIWKQSWQKCKYWPIRGLGYHQVTNEKLWPGDRMTRWRIIAETKSDICQGKYFKVSPKIFHWHLDISPGDQCASLTVDIIPQADNTITALKATKGYFYYCLLFSTVGQDIDV